VLFWVAVDEVDPSNLVFVGESGADTRLVRTHGRAPLGERGHGSDGPSRSSTIPMKERSTPLLRSGCAARRRGCGRRRDRWETRTTTRCAVASSQHSNPSYYDRRRFRTQAEAKVTVLAVIEGWYNAHRRHSALGYPLPLEYERRCAQSREAAA
jgi:putative transposase